MQLYDKDLLSVQEVRELVERSKAAQEKLLEMSQSQVDRIIESIANAGVRNARRLAQMAHDETGFGIMEDKVIKNIFASKSVFEYIRDMKTIGVIAEDEKAKTKDIAVPVGVIAGLIPSTNPTSTVLYKSEIAIKAGNSIIFSPHPNAKEAILETVKVIRQAIAEADGPEDLVSVVTIPTIQSTDTLMRHPDISLILATGGSAMVRAAYSSGTPAIGVGPGNGPAYIERSADLKKAVKRIMDSKTFDNGTICASEQSVITERDRKEAVKAEMQAQGAYFLSTEESEKLGKFILRANGTMNPMIVGKNVQHIADLAGLKVSADARVLVAEEDGVGNGHPYSNEKLAPILGFYVEDNYQKVCERCQQILHYEGAGHTFIIHSENQEIISYFAKRIPVSRFLVNAPGALGGVGAATSLMPAFTLGCGAVGGSATSDNIGPMNLLNIRKVAYGTMELDEIRKEADLAIPASEPCKLNIDFIVEKILKELERANGGN